MMKFVQSVKELIYKKERGCGILSGFKHTGCNYMTKTITNKMKPSNRVLVEMIIRNKLKEISP